MNPSELNKKWIDSYSESPQAIQAEKMAQEHGLNAAGSNGFKYSSKCYPSRYHANRVE